MRGISLSIFVVANLTEASIKTQHPRRPPRKHESASDDRLRFGVFVAGTGEADSRHRSHRGTEPNQTKPNHTAQRQRNGRAEVRRRRCEQATLGCSTAIMAIEQYVKSSCSSSICISLCMSLISHTRNERRHPSYQHSS
ncbi:hypothetical protein K461DRAFT_107256 [Myriangium duriaei CBS 260.36]|uniref:Uncharacterized protein n=1 Tax=Myriangium duriaei CBS 260.36 TaxID=1168546 RepID=A0A9P4J438_9PEZI|nr:hypothetical protein K461DRAFT_107256 [Myriangium duriaei CBS 260.36]